MEKLFTVSFIIILTGTIYSQAVSRVFGHFTCSTLTALIETTNNWSVNIDDGLLNGVVFIDLQKAFDTFDHSILVRKLCNYRISLGWFKSYLSDRTQKYSVNGHFSNATSVSVGVPQGNNLGPLLFLH